LEEGEVTFVFKGLDVIELLLSIEEDDNGWETVWKVACGLSRGNGFWTTPEPSKFWLSVTTSVSITWDWSKNYPSKDTEFKIKDTCEQRILASYPALWVTTTEHRRKFIFSIFFWRRGREDWHSHQSEQEPNTSKNLLHTLPLTNNPSENGSDFFIILFIFFYILYSHNLHQSQFFCFDLNFYRLRDWIKITDSCVFLFCCW
jgi:hypothetical protein